MHNKHPDERWNHLSDNSAPRDILLRHAGTKGVSSRCCPCLRDRVHHRAIRMLCQAIVSRSPVQLRLRLLRCIRTAMLDIEPPSGSFQLHLCAALPSELIRPRIMPRFINAPHLFGRRCPSKPIIGVTADSDRLAYISLGFYSPEGIAAALFDPTVALQLHLPSPGTIPKTFPQLRRLPL